MTEITIHQLLAYHYFWFCEKVVLSKFAARKQTRANKSNDIQVISLSFLTLFTTQIRICAILLLKAFTPALAEQSLQASPHETNVWQKKLIKLWYPQVRPQTSQVFNSIVPNKQYINIKLEFRLVTSLTCFIIVGTKIHIPKDLKGLDHLDLGLNIIQVPF